MCLSRSGNEAIVLGWIDVTVGMNGIDGCGGVCWSRQANSASWAVEVVGREKRYLMSV